MNYIQYNQTPAEGIHYQPEGTTLQSDVTARTTPKVTTKKVSQSSELAEYNRRIKTLGGKPLTTIEAALQELYKLLHMQQAVVKPAGQTPSQTAKVRENARINGDTKTVQAIDDTHESELVLKAVNEAESNANALRTTGDVLSFMMPSTYWNFARTMNDKEPLPEDAAFLFDMTAPLIGAGAKYAGEKALGAIGDVASKYTVSVPRDRFFTGIPMIQIERKPLQSPEHLFRFIDKTSNTSSSSKFDWGALADSEGERMLVTSLKESGININALTPEDINILRSTIASKAPVNENYMILIGNDYYIMKNSDILGGMQLHPTDLKRIPGAMEPNYIANFTSGDNKFKYMSTSFYDLSYRDGHPIISGRYLKLAHKTVANLKKNYSKSVLKQVGTGGLWESPNKRITDAPLILINGTSNLETKMPVVTLDFTKPITSLQWRLFGGSINYLNY